MSDDKRPTSGIRPAVSKSGIRPAVTERPPEPEYPWAKASDEDLLNYRIRDLGLTLEGTPIVKKVDQLYTELDLKGICFHPPCYLGVEWACPDEVPAIGIAFYLAHKRLRRLEKKMMLEVEGAPHGEFMRILRHECGHAVNYAFLLHRRKRWTDLFGSFRDEYRNVYHVRPYSKRFVRNLDGWYAQMHPDEDFAETFAAWLDPNVDWRKHYDGWGAMEKLEYVDELMHKAVIDAVPKITAKRSEFLWHVKRLSSTLAAHYRRRRSEHAHEYNDYYDGELLQLFTDAPDAEGPMAADFLKRHRADIIDVVAKWSLESKFNLKGLLDMVMERCGELGLKVASSEHTQTVDIVAYLVSLAVNYKHTGEFKRHR